MIRATARPFGLLQGPAPLAAYAALLIAWGNAKTLLLESTVLLPGGGAPAVLAGAGLVAVAFTTARVLGLGAADLGLKGRAWRGAAIGALIGVATALAGVAALRLVAPAIVGHAIEYAPLALIAGPALAVHVAVLLPLSVVVPEELAFRGVLLGALARSLGTRAAVLASAGVFALWHGAVLLGTIGQTTVGADPVWTPLAIAGTVVVLLSGGAAFGWLRVATGSLATSAAAHWAFNAVVLVGLWATRAG